MTKITEYKFDSVKIIRLENELLCIDVAPQIGGRIISVFDKEHQYEFLYADKNKILNRAVKGSNYDDNFSGGIDEIIPNDVPENINGHEFPDHGVLWTTQLNYYITDNKLVMEEILPCDLWYKKTLELSFNLPILTTKYQIRNIRSTKQSFLWKMHAALNIHEGDIIQCHALKAQIADKQWSRWKTETFDWPIAEGKKADVIPAKNGTTDFFFLHELRKGQAGILNPESGLQFIYSFDLKYFLYVCYFASYGGFRNLYTGIIEPCTGMPLTVNDAIKSGQITSLDSGDELLTEVSFYAGQ
jgi:hypothetical protein